MEVRLRHIDATESVHFCDCKVNEIEKVKEAIRKAGGVYCQSDKDMLPSLSHQIVLDNDSAYVEIMAGPEGT